ncbi:vascular cell adhesion protein 1 [Biomphalaria glabrata]|uniref:Ig-like domain-containing protein n=1 Tax=Biomphalaria glabrata TaxID=6526 RepID=A0A2C9KXD8_BIOGL|nr:hypothetical protein BgiMline_022266 [Biomphalaria glabrata]
MDFKMLTRDFIHGIIFLLTANITYSLASDCAVGVEGTSIRLLCKVTSSVHRLITWQVDQGGRYVDVTTCHMNGVCTTNSQAYYSFLTGTNCTVHIKSLNRNSSSWRCVWDDVHYGPPCNITVYVPPRKPTCDAPVFTDSNTAVSITCRTEKTFPTAVCQFFQYTPSGALNNTRVVHRHGPSPSSPQDFSTECSFVSDLLPLGQPVTMTLGVGMFSQPNTPIVQARNITLDLYFPVPEMDSDCPRDYVMSGSTATCTCRLSNPGSPPGQAYWISTNDEKFVTFSKMNGSSQLDFSFNSSVLSPVYYCYAVSTLGQAPPQNTLIYEPKFAYGPSTVFLDAITSPDVQFTNTTSVLLRCNVSRDQVLPGVVFSFDSANRQFPNWPYHSDGSYYTSSLIYSPETPGSFNVTCTVRNVKFHSMAAQNSTRIQAFGGYATVQLDITGRLDVDLCTRTLMPLTCTVSVSQAYPWTTSFLIINNEEHVSRTSHEREYTHSLNYNFVPSSPGRFEFRCRVQNNYTSALLAEEIKIVTVAEGTCGINSIVFGLAIGLGCSIFLLLLVIIIFVIWRRRLKTSQKQENQAVYFTVGDSKVKCIVRTNNKTGSKTLIEEPPPDYMSYAHYDKPATYIPRVSTRRKSGTPMEYDNPGYAPGKGSSSSRRISLSRTGSVQESEANIYSTVDG